MSFSCRTLPWWFFKRATVHGGGKLGAKCNHSEDEGEVEDEDVQFGVEHSIREERYCETLKRGGLTRTDERVVLKVEISMVTAQKRSYHATLRATLRWSRLWLAIKLSIEREN